MHRLGLRKASSLVLCSRICKGHHTCGPNASAGSISTKHAYASGPSEGLAYRCTPALPISAEGVITTLRCGFKAFEKIAHPSELQSLVLRRVDFAVGALESDEAVVPAILPALQHVTLSLGLQLTTVLLVSAAIPPTACLRVQACRDQLDALSLGAKPFSHPRIALFTK